MNRPIKLKSKIHHDKRGYLIETVSKKKYLNVKFSLLKIILKEAIKKIIGKKIICKIL